jgi:hypothetical protein
MAANIPLQKGPDEWIDTDLDVDPVPSGDEAVLPFIHAGRRRTHPAPRRHAHQQLGMRLPSEGAHLIGPASPVREGW